MSSLAITLFGILFVAGNARTQEQVPERFVDVPKDHWAYESVERLRQRGILIGYPDQQLRGKRTVTRYEMAVGLRRAFSHIGQPKGPAGPRGPQGPPGQRGPQGPAGPSAERPREVQLSGELLKQFQAELIQLRKELDSAAAESEKLSEETKRAKEKPRP